MQCPHLSTNPKRTCTKMLEARVNEAISDFDLTHFCQGNPIFCYYYRLSATQDTPETSTVDQERTAPPMTLEIQKKAWTTIKDLLFKKDDDP